jgi:hypothetical protein
MSRYTFPAFNTSNRPRFVVLWDPQWSKSLKAHWESLTATDFMSVEVCTFRGFVTQYILFFIDITTCVLSRIRFCMDMDNHRLYPEPLGKFSRQGNICVAGLTSSRPEQQPLCITRCWRSRKRQVRNR